jgi:hypothetical protein
MGAAYSNSQTKELVDLYLQDATIEQLAVRFNRTPKSIIAKLSKEQVYVKKGYITKLGTKPETKASMVSDIELVLDGRYYQLDKVPKPTLNALRNAVEKFDEAYQALFEENLVQKSTIDSLEEDKTILKEKLARKSPARTAFANRGPV